MQIIPVEELVPTLTAARAAASNMASRAGVPQCVVAASELVPGKVALFSVGFASVLGSEVITFLHAGQPSRSSELLSHAMQQLVDRDLKFLTPFRHEGRSYQVVPLMFVPGAHDSPALHGLVDGLDLIPPVFLEVVEVRLAPAVPDPFHGAQLVALGTAAITPESTLSELNTSLLSIHHSFSQIMESPQARDVLCDLLEEIGNVNAKNVGAFRERIIQRVQDAERVASAAPLAIVTLDLDDPLDFDPDTRPVPPPELGALGELQEFAMLCRMGATHVYRHVAEGDNDVIYLRMVIGNDETKPAAMMQAKVFTDESFNIPDLIMAADSDRAWASAVFRPGKDEFDEDDLFMTDQAMDVWDYADAAIPSGMVRIQGLTVPRHLQSDAFLAYLLDMLRWVLDEYFSSIEYWGYTIEANALTADSVVPMTPKERKRYQSAFVSVLGAVQASREDGQPQLEQDQAVFLLPN